ncbi:MAG TPA: ergothioneine biosynthesis protein EgtB [Burkholderiales bacterium]|nr:ergothioneine biosynthesis protein EgtB [Burkholderiales bacterium]
MKAPATSSVSAAAAELLSMFGAVRALTAELCRTLKAEDYVVQSSPECSPAKWHLAHTTWFFENFLLLPQLEDYRPFHPQYGYLFNSYYETVGTFFPRPLRGLLSRPTVEDVYAYRAHVDRHMAELVDRLDPHRDAATASRVTLGLHHEQQHQELLLTDVKNLFALNPLRPAYRAAGRAAHDSPAPLNWLERPAGMYAVGASGDGFAFDNETPRHRVFLERYAIASRPVTNAEFLEFMQAGGYRDASLWLSDGWRKVNEAGWQAPLYWERVDGEWWHMTLNGFQRVDANAPVCHVSYYEADAFARWAGHRLPSEHEWEVAACALPVEGNLLDSGRLQPSGATSASHQFFGDVWEWTSSSYSPYPGFRPLAGSLGEYNGKFMVSQQVLRGGSCATPGSHIRASYRNFFYPPDRWQFTGLRLAR